MKPFRKILIAFITVFTSISVISNLSRNICEEHCANQIEETFVRVNRFIENFGNNSNLRNNKLLLNNESSLLDDFDFPVDVSNQSEYEKLKYSTKEVIEQNKNNIDFTKTEIFKEISENDLYQMSIDHSYDEELEEINKDAPLDVTTSIDADIAFQQAKDILTEDGYEESLISYIDEFEFRDFCLKQELSLDEPDLRTTVQKDYFDFAQENYTNVATSLNELTDFSFMVDPSEGGTGSNGANDASSLDNNSQSMISPAEVMTLEQIAMIFSADATTCITISSGLLVSAKYSFLGGWIGKIVAAALIVLGIIVLLPVLKEIIRGIQYFLSFLLVLLALPIFVTLFFTTLSSYTSQRSLSTALDAYGEQLKTLNISRSLAERRVKESIKVKGKTISISKLPDNLIVPLGVGEDYRKIANDNGYVHYDNSSYDQDLTAYGYDGVWLINEIFIYVMVLNDAKFLLCSRPSIYYDKSTKQILELRAYSRELQLIDVTYNYHWTEANVDPYVPVLAIR